MAKFLDDVQFYTAIACDSFALAMANEFDMRVK